MFKTLRARGGIASVGRIPLRIESQARLEEMNIQRVRFKQFQFRPRRFIATTIAVALLYHVYLRTITAPLDKLAEEAEKTLDARERKELEEDSEPFFIPFPGTTKQTIPRPYRGSDPEWQEFVKISKNIALGQQIKDELANHVKATCEKSPAITMRCGKDMKIRKYWLDVDFPSSPPPEFERSGIEISDDYIAWTTMPVDSLTVFQIRQALWPTALAQSTWSWAKALVTGDDPINILGVPGTTGIPGMTTATRNGPPSLDVFLASRNNKPSTDSTDSSKTQDSPKDSTTPIDPQNVDEAARLKAKLDLTLRKIEDLKKSMSTFKGDSSLTKSGENLDTTQPSNVSSYTQGVGLGAYRAFRKKLAQTWKFAPNYPPRGSVLVSGLVELDGGKAWLVVDVRAAWDPKTRTYDSRSMQIKLRRMQWKKQGPAGGR